MRTVPMKARTSNSSWRQFHHGGLAPSLLRLERENKRGNRRYIFSIALFAFAMTGLVVGSVGGFVQEASAQEARRGYLSEWLFGNNRAETNTNRETNQQRNQREEETITTPAPVTQPAQTTPVTPAPTQAQAPVTTPATTTFAPVTTPQTSTPVPADTAPEIAATTSAQAAVASQPVTYTSQQISGDTRDQLLTSAAIAAASGGLILIMSSFGTGGAFLAKANPMRIRIPVKEVVGN